MNKKIRKIIDGVREKKPLVHCITNPISINLCANGILAVGAQPIMAEHPSEAEEITSASDALLLNLGNITDVRMVSMMISAQTAIKSGIPTVLDAVGVSCSSLRHRFANKLISENQMSVIKGNYSEIVALNDADSKTRGVDTEIFDENVVLESAMRLSEKTNATVVASGKTDIIAEKSRIFRVKNGTPKLSLITGSGCLLGALTACYASFSSPTEGAVSACAVLGICGEIAEKAEGNGSFQAELLDALCNFNGTFAEKYMKTEEKYYA